MGLWLTAMEREYNMDNAVLIGIGSLRRASLAALREKYREVFQEETGVRERQGPIHLALLDLMMPGMKGPQLYQCLKEIHSKIAVLFMTRLELITDFGIGARHERCPFRRQTLFSRDLVHRVNEILGNEEVCTLLADETEAVHA